MPSTGIPLVQVTESDDAIVVRFLESKIFNDQKMVDILQELIPLAVKLGRRELRLDLDAVKYLQSSALGKLIGLNRHVTAGGGRMTLCNVHPVAYRVMEATKLHLLFTIEQAAVREGEASAEP